MQYGKRDTYSSTITSSSSRAAPFSRSSGYYTESMTVNQPYILHTKRPSLPTFSGDRADWPEFRCVWTALAESQYSNKVQLAMELKRSCKGRAADRVRHIYVTHDYAYEEIWERLREEYDDPGLCSQEAINQLMSLRPVSDHDFEGLVKVIDTVDGIFNQLRELHQLCAIHAVDVDRVSANLPATTRMEWLRLYSSLSSAEKMTPFEAFVMFLRRERAAVARLAESMPSQKRTFKRASAHLGQGEGQGMPPANTGSRKKCALQHDGHLTKDCKMFLNMAIPERYVALRRSRRCFNCFENHVREECTTPTCKECGKFHHKLLCTAQQTDTRTDYSSSHLASAGAMALYPICKAKVKGSPQPVTVLLDGGSNASYITTRCAQRLKLKILDRVTLNVTTVGGKNRDYRSAIYEADLRTIEGKTVKVNMYELPKITGKIALLDRPVIEELFPDFDSDALRRTTEEVDLLIGTDYFGLHPKEELGKAGEHLSVMKGQLGVCLIGTHPLLKEADQLKGEVPRTLHLSEHRTQTTTIDARARRRVLLREGRRSDIFNMSSRGSDCFKCGQSGHWARDCRSDEENERPRMSMGFGRGGGVLGALDKCYKCSRPGHFARECRVEADRCYKCNQLGHLSRDCKIDIGQGACYNCKGTDHIQRDCPNGNTRQCYKCSDTGHLARECPETKAQINDRTCYQCGDTGHLARDCRDKSGSPPPRGGNDSKSCYGCGRTGHIARDCQVSQSSFKPR